MFLGNINAQNKRIDSLKVELDNHKISDTTRVNLLYDLAFSLYQKDIHLTNSYIQEAEKIAKQLDYKRGEAYILSLKGIIESRKSNYDLGLDYFQQSLEIFQSLNDKKGIASSFNSIGVSYLQQSKNNDALIYLKKAFKINEELGDKNKLVSNALNLGSIHSNIGKYSEAIYYYELTLKLSKEIDHKYGIPYALNGLGYVYNKQGNQPAAFDYYNQALFYKEQLKDTLGITISLNSIGNTYRSFGKYDKSLEYHNRSLELAEKIENKDLIAINKGNIGLVFKEKGELEKALYYMNESLKMSREINDFGQMANCLFDIGEVNLSLKNTKEARQSFEKSIEISLENNIPHSLALNYLGIAESYYDEKQFKKALFYTLKGESIASELNLLEALNNSYELLSNIYKNLGNYKEAFENHQKFKKFSDSLFNEENIKKITQLEYEYKYKQTLDSASIRELKLKKTVQATSQDLQKSQRNYLWAIIGVLSISIILGSIIFYEKLKNEKSKTKHAVMEQKLLRSQMTPHFIFNSLSVLQGMILNKEEKKSIHYLSKFSKLLRLTLENSRDKIVLLSQELAAVQDYLTLQNLEDETYKFTVTVEESIETSLFKIPPMLIQPFVENAIEHAFKNQKDERRIDINLSYSDKKLICTIADNGVGINSKVDTKTTKRSLATTITSERLNVLSKDFNMEGYVTIENRQKFNEQGTLVTLVIPHIITPKNENITS
ncbi:MAG: tetratricopeptide repeat protein [Cyclobacteriaceae bacterium]|nr:tetratricopeptide repeat protein [Cyclobacteriaceae bacterium]